jgi:hypothetical protein
MNTKTPADAAAKYVLIEHGEGSDPSVIRAFNTPEERIKATREAILGPDMDGCELDLSDLEKDGRMSFEGDPPLSWLRAFVETISVDRNTERNAKSE